MIASKLITTSITIASWTVLLLSTHVKPAISASQNHLQVRNTSCPGVYDFGLSIIDVIHHRSASKDTIYIAATVTVNGTYQASYNISNYYGKHGNGKFNADILFTNITVPDNSLAVLSYVIMNLGHGSRDKNEQQVQNYAYLLSKKGVQEVVNALSGNNIGEAIAGVITDIISEISEEVGSVLEGLGSFIEDILTLKNGCDGLLGAGLHGFRGIDICSMDVALQGTDVNKGVQDQELADIQGIICSVKTSLYNVSWFAGTNGSEQIDKSTEYVSGGSSLLGLGIGWLWWVAIAGGLYLL
jgi:hypothetical protein